MHRAGAVFELVQVILLRRRFPYERWISVANGAKVSRLVVVILSVRRARLPPRLKVDGTLGNCPNDNSFNIYAYIRSYFSTCQTSFWAGSSIPKGERQTLLHRCSQCPFITARRPSVVRGRVSAPAVYMLHFHGQKTLISLITSFEYNEQIWRDGRIHYKWARLYKQSSPQNASCKKDVSFTIAYLCSMLASLPTASPVFVRHTWLQSYNPTA